MKVLVCIPNGLCAGPKGWRSTLPALGHACLGLGAQGCLCRSSMVSPLGGSTHFIFSWCICRLSSCPVSSGVPISCSRATWLGNGQQGGCHGWPRLCPQEGGGNTEAPRKAAQGGGGAKQAGVSRAAVVLTLEESRIRFRGAPDQGGRVGGP